MTERPACTKRRYASERSARQKLRELRKKRRKEHAQKCEDHAYRCQFCHAWHLTSQPRWLVIQ